MKKALLRLLIMSVSIILISLGALSCGCTQGADRIEGISGNVNYSSDDINWREVTVPPVTKIKSGTWLETGASGEAEIIFSNADYDVACAIMEDNTRLRTRTPGQETLFTQYDGTTFVRWLTGDESDITIEGFGCARPTGTMLRISIVKDRAKIAVYEGSVFFIPLLKEDIKISANEEVTLAPQGELISLIDYSFTSDEVRSFQKLGGEAPGDDTQKIPDIRTPIKSIDFLDVAVGNSMNWTTTIYNDGDDTLIVNSITRTSGSLEFTYISPTAPFKLDAGESQQVTIRFAPRLVGSREATFTVSSNDPDEANVTFSVSGNSMTASLPDLTIITGSPTSTPATVEPGGTVTLSDWTVKNQGNTSSGPFSTGFYLSSDSVITTSDVFLAWDEYKDMPPGTSLKSAGPTLTIPDGVPAGNYYIGILVDIADAVSESSENNNYVAGQITISTPSPPLNISNVSDMAAGGSVIYVSTIGADSPLYKSTDGGDTWSKLESAASFLKGASVKAISVALDDPDFVAIITSANKVAYSTNGGATWTDLGQPSDTSPAVTGTTLHDIDISPGPTRYLAVASKNNNGSAELFTIKLAAAETWQARYTGAKGIASGQTIMAAVSFSPNFVSDQAITVVTGNANSATLQILYAFGDGVWNDSIAYLTYGWAGGVQIDSSVNGGVAAADIELPTTYLAFDEDERLAYIGIAGATSGGGIYRITDTVVREFQAWNGGDEGDIGSIAYNEEGKLVAGSYIDNRVYQFLSPNAAQPMASQLNTLKQPGGENRTTIVWSGNNVLAGTQGSNSTISVSTDDGYTFNDID
jgi:hypothetical protein